MTPSPALPGFRTPAVGFEQPFEMLRACHERVQRTLNLLERLLTHIDQHGHDSASRSAAADVLRYFDIAAPLHHEDEELHIFPALARRQTPALPADLQAALAALPQEHARMTALWAELRQALLRWRDDPAADLAVAPATRQQAADFIALYAAHIVTEETLVYPAAQACFDAEGLLRIGTEMQSRRLAGAVSGATRA